MEMIRYILAVLIAYFSLTLVFKVFDQRLLGLFAPVQKLVSKSKWKGLPFVVMIFVWAILKSYLNLGNLGSGFLLGGLMSLKDVCVKPYSG